MDELAQWKRTAKTFNILKGVGIYAFIAGFLIAIFTSIAGALILAAIGLPLGLISAWIAATYEEKIIKEEAERKLYGG